MVSHGGSCLTHGAIIGICGLTHAAANNARGLTNVFNKKSLKIPKGNQNPHIEEQKMEIMV